MRKIIIGGFVLIVIAVASAFFFVLQKKKQTDPSLPERHNTQTEAQSSQPSTEQEYLKEITYSNIFGTDITAEVEKVLVHAGVSMQTASDFLADVFYYNKTVGAKLGDAFVGEKEQFRTVQNLVPAYDLENIEKLWENYDADDPGENCRITSFRLLDEMIAVENPLNEYAAFLFLDKESLSYPKRKINRDHIPKFQTLFASIPTELTTDQNIHREKIHKHFAKHNITFENAEHISLITVWMHDDLDNVLFVGHTGVLLKKSDDEWWFIEKISFQEPYQLVVFKNKVALNDYLMAKYDVSWSQSTARPLIFENDRLIEEFRLNPETTKKG